MWRVPEPLACASVPVSPPGHPFCGVTQDFPARTPSWFQPPYHGVLCTECARTYWLILVCTSLITLPEHPLCRRPHNRPACTYFSFSCPAREPSAWRTQRPPKPAPTSATAVLPEHSLCGAPWTLPPGRRPYPTSAPGALLGCPLCETPQDIPAQALAWLRPLCQGKLCLESSMTSQLTPSSASATLRGTLSAGSPGTALAHAHFSFGKEVPPAVTH